MSTKLLQQAVQEGLSVDGRTPMSTITESSARLNAALQGKISADDRQLYEVALQKLVQEDQRRNNSKQDQRMSLVMA